MWLARCLVMNGKARQAWEIYLKIEGTQESFAMLQLLANDCYRAGAFLYAAKAFETLERLDWSSSPAALHAESEMAHTVELARELEAADAEDDDFASGAWR